LDAIIRLFLKDLKIKFLVKSKHKDWPGETLTDESFSLEKYKDISTQTYYSGKNFVKRNYHSWISFIYLFKERIYNLCEYEDLGNKKKRRRIDIVAENPIELLNNAFVHK
jgi:hypothetical protein